MIGIKNILVFVFFAGTIPAGISQDTAFGKKTPDPATAYISWVKQYPSSLKDKQNRRFTERVVDFVFGKKNNLELDRPVAMMALNPEKFWVLDQENGVIFKVQNEVGEITQFHNKQYKSFISLVGICRLPGNKMLFTDSYWNKIFMFSPDKKELKVLNDTLSFDRPTGIAYSALNREIWVVETNAHRITVLDESGNLKKRIGNRGTGPGEFNFPTSICIDRTGKVFVVDALNFRIQEFSKDGDFISYFGKQGDVAGSFARPKGIATDSYGNIYIADALFNAVQIFDQSGRLLYTFGTQGRSEGEFWMPSGIYIDEKDYIYVADSYNSRVQIFQLKNEGQ